MIALYQDHVGDDAEHRMPERPGRALDAMHCGSVLVTEHSTGFEPLRPGGSHVPNSLFRTAEPG